MGTEQLNYYINIHTQNVEKSMSKLQQLGNTVKDNTKATDKQTRAGQQETAQLKKENSAVQDLTRSIDKEKKSRESNTKTLLTISNTRDKWNDKYPIVIKSWQNNWERLSQYFKYPEEIRRIIYTTNTIEAVHRQFRKLTKTKGAFPNQDSLLKLLYMGIQNAGKKWTMPIQNWSLTLSQLAIFFEGRLDKELKI